MSRGIEQRLLSGVVLVGPSGETLRRYEAPEAVQRVIARRAGALLGTGALPHATLEQAIQNSMSGDGVPRWDQVTQEVGKTVRDIYHGTKR